MIDGQRFMTMTTAFAAGVKVAIWSSKEKVKALIERLLSFFFPPRFRPVDCGQLEGRLASEMLIKFMRTNDEK